MRKELEEKIINKFDFYKPDETHQRNLIAFGFECSDGWFDLIYKLSEDLNKLDLPENFEVVQVKEKFASLRFYTNITTTEIDKLIYKAEEESYTICEVCGKKGKARGNGWVRVLCDECYNGDK